MERFVKNFILMSIFYFAVAAIVGVLMLVEPDMLAYKFVHSHMMLLGWVSMMIYGVGYHILPRFVGKLLRSVSMGVAQFWLANVGLLGMLLFYTLMQFHPEVPAYRSLTVLSGVVEVLSVLLFFYNMTVTLLGKAEE
jgi:cytochrome c oxidase cbb3-type subunit 1